jgi:phenylalanyl-tRNA synthetase alpha chain
MSMRENITINDPREKEAISRIEKLNDFKSLRIRKLLALPDLTRKPNSPIKFLTEKVVDLERFKDFDVVEIPKVMTIKDNFDTLNTPADHPSRKESDTYYLDKDLVLRTHTTAAVSYTHLTLPTM